MSAKGNPGKGQKSSVEYLQIDLTKAYRSELQKWLDSGIDLWVLVERAVNSGLKFSTSYDAYNDCLQAALTRLPEGNSGGTTTVLVGRGPDLLKAVQAVFFKYEVILQENFEQGDWKNARGVTDWS